MGPSEAQIEAWVQERRTERARLAIRALMRSGRWGSAKAIQCCDWFRRLGLYVEAYEALRIEKHGFSSDPVLLLWGARTLNLLGASAFALEIAARARPTTAQDHRVLGNIYLSNFEHAAALGHFREMNAREPDPEAYVARLNQVSLADALVGMGQPDEALAIVREVARRSLEPLLKGIAYQAEGEYLANLGDFRSALKALGRASDAFPAEEDTLDRGFLLKWRGYALGRLGKEREAKAEFARADRILRQPSLRVEAWLDSLRLQSELGWVGAAEARRLAHYPGLPPGFLRKLGARGPRLPAVFGKPVTAGLVLDPGADEGRIGKKRFLGIGAELTLAALLGVAGAWGLHWSRAATLLWPEQPFSLPTHKSRLRQLAHRLRREYGLGIATDEGNLRLLRASGLAVTLSEPGLPTAIRGLASFAGEDVERMYSLSRARSRAIVRGWVERGWARAEGRGPATRYVVIFPYT